MKAFFKKYSSLFLYLSAAVIISFGEYSGFSLSLGAIFAAAINSNVIISSIFALVASLLSPEISPYAAFSITIILALSAYLLRLLKGRIRELALLAASAVLGVIVGLFSGETPFYIAISSAASALSYYFFGKISFDDFDFSSDVRFVSLAVSTVFVALGTSEIKIFSTSLLNVFLPFGILSFFSLFSREKGLLSSLLLALSAYIATNDGGYLVAVPLFAFAAYLFCGKKPNLAPFILTIENVILFFSKTFADDNIISLFFFAIGALSNFLLPPVKKDEARSNVIPEQIINETLKLSANRIKELASTYRGIAETLQIADKIENLPEQIISSCKISCGYCKFKSDCKVFLCADDELEPLAINALSKGSVNLLDVGDFIYNTCKSHERLISSVNSAVRRTTEKSLRQKEKGEFASALKQIFTGLSIVLESEAGKLDESLRFDRRLELEIYDELKLSGIKAKEIFCVKSLSGAPTVKLTLEKNEKNGKAVAKAISNACGMKMIAAKSSYSNAITYIPKPSCEVTFGVAKATKGNRTGKSGDNYLLQRISDYSYILALSDGMGSGNDADYSSEKTVSAIENLFKAGFSSDAICTLINSLLSFSGKESFSATDIAVIDAITLNCVLIKLGTPPTFVIKDKIIELSGDSLPVGILDEITPTKEKIALSLGDMMILMSDGIYDALKEKTAYYISKGKSRNPQEFCDYLLKIAIEKNGEVPKDDMTVIAIKIV